MLANAVFAEPLLHFFSTPGNGLLHGNTLFELGQQQREWLSRLDKQPEKLMDCLNSPGDYPQERIKLGIYHEKLWRYFLTHSPETQLLCHNLKVSIPLEPGPKEVDGQKKIPSRDLGEFDFIYLHEKHGLIHLEVANKYYLASHKRTDEWMTWIGPGCRDRLDIKVEHSLEKQINLSDHPAAKMTLQRALEDFLGKNSEFTPRKQLCIGGKLFYPASERHDFTDEHGLPPPEQLNPQHRSAYWWHLSHWKRQVDQNKELVFCIAEKPFWLDSDNGYWLHQPYFEPVVNLPDKLDEPVFIFYQSGNARQPCGSGFLVPDDWPVSLPVD